MSVTIEKTTEHRIHGARVLDMRVAVVAESAPVITTDLSEIEHVSVASRAAATPKPDVAESGPAIIPSFGALVTDTLDVRVVGL